jgi:protein XagA
MCTTHLKIIGSKKYYSKKEDMKKKLLVAIALFIAVQSFGGFPIGRGKYLLVPSYNLYQAKGYWDKDRNYTAFSNNGKFSSHYFSIYGGFGISDKVDFVANLPYVIQRRQESNFVEQNSSFGDATVGLSYLLNSFDYYKFLTVTGSLIIPLYSNNSGKLPYTGFQQVGAEVKLGFSGTNRERLRNTYYDVTAGLRQFFSSEGPTQLFLDALFGVPLDDLNKLTFSINAVNSTSSSNVFNPNNLFLNRQFSYFRLSTGYGRKIDQNYQIFFTIFSDITGKNTGKGGGGSISLVAKL